MPPCWPSAAFALRELEALFAAGRAMGGVARTTARPFELAGRGSGRVGRALIDELGSDVAAGAEGGVRAFVAADGGVEGGDEPGTSRELAPGLLLSKAGRKRSSKSTTESAPSSSGAANTTPSRRRARRLGVSAGTTDCIVVPSWLPTASPVPPATTARRASASSRALE